MPSSHAGKLLQLTNSPHSIELQLLAILKSGSKLGKVSEVIAMEGDASTRRYFRAHFTDNRTLILVLYPVGEWNQALDFLEIGNYLGKLHLPVPFVVASRPEARLIILEDLGDCLLETALQGIDDNEKNRLYESAVDILVQLNKKASMVRAIPCVAFSRAFDYQKLMQEMEFFLVHFVKGFCGIEPHQVDSSVLAAFFHVLCTTLAERPRVFAHRDYHARNLIVKDNKLYMIDFQDARLGPAQYDLASLLKDSYVDLDQGFIDHLVGYYCSGTSMNDVDSVQEFRRIFDMMSLQRNLKALGTFGYQTSVCKSSRYLSAIPRTVRNIADNMLKYPELAPYTKVVQDLVIEPGLVPPDPNMLGIS